MLKDFRPYTVLTLLAIVTIGLGTTVYHYIEKLPWIDAYYLSVITLSTVGYGDFSPQTDIGKIFTTVYILGGVGIITAFITVTIKRRQDKFMQNHQQRHPQD